MAGLTPAVRMVVPGRASMPASYGWARVSPVLWTPGSSRVSVPYEATLEGARIARELEEFNNRSAPAPREQKAVVRKAGNKTVKLSRRRILEGWEGTTSVRNAPVTRAEVVLHGGDARISTPTIPTTGVAPLPPGAPMGTAPFRGYGNAIPPHIQKALDERARVADILGREYNAVRVQAAQAAADDRLIEGIYKEAYADQATAPFRRMVAAEAARETTAANIEAARVSAGKLKEEVKQGVKGMGKKVGSAVSTLVGLPLGKVNQGLAAADDKLRETLPGYIVSRIWHSKDPTGRRDRLWKFLGKHPATTTVTAAGLAAAGIGLAAVAEGARALEEGDRVAAMNSAERGDAYNRVTNRLARLERDVGEITSQRVSQDNQLRDMKRYAAQMSGIGKALRDQLEKRMKAAGDDAQARTNAMQQAAAAYSAAYGKVESAMEEAGAAELFHRWNDDLLSAGRTVSPEAFARGIGLKEVTDGR